MGVDAGGIARLHAVLRDHRWTLEADLLRFFQADLLDLHRDRLTWRRLTVLYRALPRQSLTRTAENGWIEPFGPEAFVADEARRNQLWIGTQGEHRPEPMPGSPLWLTPAERAAKAEERRTVEAQKWAAYQQRKRERREATAAKNQTPEED